MPRHSKWGEMLLKRESMLGSALENQQTKAASGMGGGQKIGHDWLKIVDPCVTVLHALQGSRENLLKSQLINHGNSKP